MAGIFNPEQEKGQRNIGKAHPRYGASRTHNGKSSPDARSDLVVATP